ncbi:MULTISPECIES: Bcr/CflA family efflux MFS transporter [unclassified Legionella]|uniref:Bcr/CflA family efflux MFS transporter n=1 Tax=unclassified Legionella TaxID=2622702 RepID=UPI0013EF6BDC|nr:MULTISPECIES: Bcr/CflA family efflux MFS transporter [unclassified Legionella]MDI9818755.1 Bcr/CflA family efflux MFS transporter [Legionella sp. PL877]
MSKRYYAILPNLIVPLGGLGTDIYLPSLPSMVNEFGVSDSQMQLTITSYVLAMGLVQYLAGPVSDALGRKRLIISSLIMQFVAVVAILFAGSVNLIIIARFFQGLACAFMIVPARAILNDCFEGDELKKKFNYLTISFALAPIIAPFIGGYCQHYFGWQASFYFILIYIVFLLSLLVLFTKETIEHTKAFSLKQISQNYSLILHNKGFMYITLLLSVMFGYTSLFTVLGPFIFQNKFGFSPVAYGYIALSIGIAWFMGNVTNRLFFEIATHKKMMFALGLQTAMSTVLLIIASTSAISAVTTFIPVFFMVYAAAIIFPIFVGESLVYFPDMAASSNAFLFASTWIAFSLYTLIATQISVDNLIPLALAYLLVNCMGYWLYFCIRKNG